ncbi:MAG TPA: NUDIX domain-containing protein, partial [Burkholderiales bacterium]
RLRASVKRVTPLYEGFLKVKRYEIEAEKHGGGFATLTLEVMERGHAVAVLAYDPARDEVVLVNELRAGELAAGDYPYAEALVAGGIGDGESPVEAAIREVKEETGLDLRQPFVVHPGAYVSPGGTSERIALVAGTVDASRAGGVHGNPHEGEDILTVVLPAEEFVDRARRGAITDLKTLFAAYWLAAYRARRSAPAGRFEPFA